MAADPTDLTSRCTVMDLEVRAAVRLSPSFVRVSLAGDELRHLTPLGADHRVRALIPVLGPVGAVPDPSLLPVTRTLTVRSVRHAGTPAAVLEVDVHLHGLTTTGAGGPLATWALECGIGDPVTVVDAGVGALPHPSCREVEIVADAGALPAAAGILASLSPAATGRAVLELAHPDDRRALTHPAGVDVTWVVRRGFFDGRGGPTVPADLLSHLPRERRTRLWACATGGAPTVAAARRHWADAGVPAHRVAAAPHWWPETTAPPSPSLSPPAPVSR